jgi:hypothetical protein
VISKFDVWAKRDLAVLFNRDLLTTHGRNSELPAYKRRLVMYAEMWLKAAFDNALQFQRQAGIDADVDSMMVQLRGMIIARFEHWCAEACGRLQEARCCNGASEAVSSDRTSALPPWLPAIGEAFPQELAARPAEAEAPSDRLEERSVDNAEVEQADTVPAESPAGPLAVVWGLPSKALLKHRNQLVDEYLKTHGFETKKELCRLKLLITDRALRAMKSGGSQSTYYGYYKLLEVLHKLNISVEEWTRDPPV